MAPVGRLRQFFSWAFSPSPAKKMVKAVKGDLRSPGKNAIDERRKIFDIERSRLEDEKNTWSALEESAICGEGVWALAELATCRRFELRSPDRAVVEIGRDLFKRIGYYYQRMEYMALFPTIGNLFLICDKGPAYRRKALEQINRLRMPSSYQMMRLTNSQGDFVNPLKRAFVQFPWVELEKINRTVGKSDYAREYNGLVYPAMTGTGSGLQFSMRGGRRKIYFSHEEIIHARFRPSYQPVKTGYGVGLFRSGFVDINRVQMALQDLSIGRTLSAFARTVGQFDEHATQESVEEFDKLMREHSPNAGTAYTIQNGKMYLLDAKNHQIMQIDDIWLDIQIIGMILKLPLELLGLGADRVTGEILDQLIQRLKSTIAAYNLIEEYEILVPLLLRELMYHGKLGAEFDFVFPEVSVEDINKKLKRDSTMVQDGSKSRKRMFMEHHQATEEEWRKEESQIIHELETIGQVQNYQPPGENSHKGQKGATRKSKADQDISDYPQ